MYSTLPNIILINRCVSCLFEEGIFILYLCYGNMCLCHLESEQGCVKLTSDQAFRSTLIRSNAPGSLSFMFSLTHSFSMSVQRRLVESIRWKSVMCSSMNLYSLMRELRVSGSEPFREKSCRSLSLLTYLLYFWWFWKMAKNILKWLDISNTKNWTLCFGSL